MQTSLVLEKPEDIAREYHSNKISFSTACRWLLKRGLNADKIVSLLRIEDFNKKIRR